MAATLTDKPAPTGADDMMAELAGDEIDRLLAEAESNHRPLAPITRQVEAVIPAAEREADDESNAMAAEIDRLVSASTPAVSSPEAATSVDEVDEEQRRAQAAILAGSGLDSSDEKMSRSRAQHAGPSAEPAKAVTPAMTGDEIDQLLSQSERRTAAGAEASLPRDVISGNSAPSDVVPVAVASLPDAPISEIAETSQPAHRNRLYPLPKPVAQKPISSVSVDRSREEAPIAVEVVTPITEASVIVKSPTKNEQLNDDYSGAVSLESLEQEAATEIRQNASPLAVSPATMSAAPPADSSPAPVEIVAMGDEDVDSVQPSIAIRIMELINVPFDWLPDIIRDAAGKLGIMTLLNATAVLTYVLIFRHHPPRR